MEHKLLKVTPFGFIFELENTDCFATKDYEIELNGEFYAASNKNVQAIFGLKPDTSYDVELCGIGCKFTVHTKKPGYVINVLDYNASGNGKTDDTSSINAAIYTAPEGSVVFIPEGQYLVDQIFLKSGVDIYLEKGATILQSFCRDKLAILKGYQKNYDHSKVTINASWEGHPLDTYCSLLYGKEVKDVHVYGDGCLDGNGDVGGFWVDAKVKKDAWRPKNVFIVGSQNIEISGITSRNSASWNIHPFYCENVALRCLTVESVEVSPNTDGINPESCHNVDIIGCHFSVGDDCIAIKSGKYYMSTAYLRHTQNVTVRNCFLEKGHGGVVMGSEMSCGIYNVNVTQCVFKNTDRGFRIKTRRGRGKHAIADGITFDNCVMDKVKHCFVINMFYNCDPDGKSDYVKSKETRDVDDYTPAVRNITVTNVKATNIPGSAVFIYGLPESKVQNVTIKNNDFSYAPERLLECPAMMCDFEVTEPLDVFIENALNVVNE